jgi:hypothetical protein
MFTPSLGTVKEHLLMSSFMEDHTQWMGDDDQDDNHDHDGTTRSENEEDNKEDAAHDDEEEEVEHVEDEDRSTPANRIHVGPSLSRTSYEQHIDWRQN